jgi:hypothetical protein
MFVAHGISPLHIHNCKHHGRFDMAEVDKQPIQELKKIDKRPLLVVIRGIVVTKAPLDEDIRDIAIGKKTFKVEGLDQQRQDIL